MIGHLKLKKKNRLVIQATACAYIAVSPEMCVSYMGELTVWIVFPTVAICMYRSSPLVPLDSCLTAAACLSSAF